MIEFQNVAKNYVGEPVLEQAGFRIQLGERVGIVGPNGAGKSTLFALITGEISPDQGKVYLPPDCRIGHLRQLVAPKNADQPVLEYVCDVRTDLHEITAQIHEIEHQLADAGEAVQAKLLSRLGNLQTRFEALGGYRYRHLSEKALSGLGFAETRFHEPLSSFSGGWQMRAELARCLISDPDLLLLDEPTNYLDLPAIEWLEHYLEGFPGTLLLISHDRFLLTKLTTTTLEVAHAQVTRYECGYSQYVQERVAREEHNEACRKKQQRERQKAEQFIERFRAKSTKASLVQSKIKQIEKMEQTGAMRKLSSPGTIRLRPPPHSGMEMVRLEDAGATYDGTTWILRQINLQIARGDKIALVGLNGMGKTTLLRLLAGRMAPSEGCRTLGHKVRIGYQSQEFTDILTPSDTVLASVKAVADSLREGELRSLLGGFGFSGDDVEKTVAVLSGGERVRLAFARLLVNPPNLLLLDEPTTHLDIQAREALETALKTFEGTVCLVSHDTEFVRNVATSIIEMVPPGIRRYAGNYDYYLQKRNDQTTHEASSPPIEQSRGSRVVDRRARRRERAEQLQQFSKDKKFLQQQVARMEREIFALEQERETWVAALSDGNPRQDFAEINRRLAFIQERTRELSRRWEDCAEELETREREFQASRDE